LNRAHKNSILKILILIVVTLKVSVFVYENFNSIEIYSEEVSLVDSEDTKSEKKEIDEEIKIVQSLLNNNSSTRNGIDINADVFANKYSSRYLESSTPPPEVIL
jgi:viroplasmin and RNaseH domain-containing protein